MTSWTPNLECDMSMDKFCYKEYNEIFLAQMNFVWKCYECSKLGYFFIFFHDYSIFELNKYGSQHPNLECDISMDSPSTTDTMKKFIPNTFRLKHYKYFKLEKKLKFQFELQKST